MVTSAWLGRACAFVTAFMAVATAAGAVPAKYAWIPLAISGGLQAFQHPVQQSTNDNKAATVAVALRGNGG